MNQIKQVNNKPSKKKIECTEKQPRGEWYEQ